MFCFHTRVVPQACEVASLKTHAAAATAARDAALARAEETERNIKETRGAAAALRRDYTLAVATARASAEAMRAERDAAAVIVQAAKQDAMEARAALASVARAADSKTTRAPSTCDAEDVTSHHALAVAALKENLARRIAIASDLTTAVDASRRESDALRERCARIIIVIHRCIVSRCVVRASFSSSVQSRRPSHRGGGARTACGG